MSQAIYRLRKAIREPLQVGEPNDPLINPKLAKFTLEELLDEVAQRSTGWNHCAVGERFGIAENDDRTATREIMAEGITQHQANVILQQGREFENLILKARESYRAIQRVQKQ